VIDFRYHVVSIVAVFLALTVGIVLGSSLFNEAAVRELHRQANQLRDDNASLHLEKRDLQRDTQYRDEFVRQVAPTLVRDKLAGQPIVIVTLPGADGKVVDGLAKLLTDQSGARVTGQVAIKNEFIDDKQQTTLNTLAAKLKPPAMTLPEGSAQEAAAAEIAEAVVTSQPSGGDSQDNLAGSTILAGLKEGGFLTVKGSPEKRASLAVVVASSGPALSGEEAEKANQAYLAVVAALNRSSRGAVLAGPERSAEDGGVIAALRNAGKAAKDVSSVDIADTEPGRVAVALALVAETQGKSGHYGVHGRTDGPLPPILSQPAT
jgi:Copper transport outer membrane protein, MctB